MESTNNTKKFEEALHLLNEAAKEKKDEIQKLLGDKYLNIREAIEELVEAKADDIQRVKKIAKKALEDGGEKVKEATSDLDKKVHENPWAYLGGVAIGALLMGFMMGSSKKD